MQTYEVSIFVEVTDEKALYQAAFDRMKQDGFASDDDANDLLLDEEGEVNVSACLRMLLDPGESPPGTQIHDSSVE